MKMIFLAAALGVASASCALNTRETHPARDLNLISREQLAENHFHSTWDAVSSLHSNWLLGRSASTDQSRVLVYLDEVRLGGIQSLKTMNVFGVSFIRYYDGLAATARWGLDHGAGVIYVSMHPVVTK